MATTKKTSTVKKTATTAAKKAVKTVASKVAEVAVTTAATKAKTVKKTAAKKYVYVFFNCNDNKDFHSMNIRYNNEVFADSASGRKALLQKVKDEVAAGRVNVSGKKAVEQDILKGDPTEATKKLQYGDIERLVFSGM